MENFLDFEIKDEILDGKPYYIITSNNNGTSNINLATPIIQEGTDLNKQNLEKLKINNLSIGYNKFDVTKEIDDNIFNVALFNDDELKTYDLKDNQILKIQNTLKLPSITKKAVTTYTGSYGRGIGIYENKDGDLILTNSIGSNYSKLLKYDKDLNLLVESGSFNPFTDLYVLNNNNIICTTQQSTSKKYIQLINGDTLESISSGQFGLGGILEIGDYLAISVNLYSKEDGSLVQSGVIPTYYTGGTSGTTYYCDQCIQKNEKEYYIFNSDNTNCFFLYNIETHTYTTLTPPRSDIGYTAIGYGDYILWVNQTAIYLYDKEFNLLQSHTFDSATNRDLVDIIIYNYLDNIFEIFVMVEDSTSSSLSPPNILSKIRIKINEGSFTILKSRIQFLKISGSTKSKPRKLIDNLYGIRHENKIAFLNSDTDVVYTIDGWDTTSTFDAMSDGNNFYFAWGEASTNLSDAHGVTKITGFPYELVTQYKINDIPLDTILKEDGLYELVYKKDTNKFICLEK